MTRENIKTHWEQILAFKNDKTIQVKSLSTGIWHDTNDPSFDIMYEYRVKPEPKLVPFKFSDAKFLLGKIVKGRSCIFIISNVSEHGIYNSLGNYTFKELLNNCTFEDGSPCGIIIQNE